MSIIDPRTVCDNYGLGQVDYEDLILHSPIRIRAIDLKDNYDGDSFPRNCLRVTNQSLRRGN